MLGEAKNGRRGSRDLFEVEKQMDRSLFLKQLAEDSFLLPWPVASLPLPLSLPRPSPLSLPPSLSYKIADFKGIKSSRQHDKLVQSIHQIKNGVSDAAKQF